MNGGCQEGLWQRMGLSLCCQSVVCQVVVCLLNSCRVCMAGEIFDVCIVNHLDDVGVADQVV